MKAKDWAAKLTESPEGRGETLRAFVEEIGMVAGQRGGSLAAVEGAVREQRVKWQAVCRECPAVAADTFESLLDAYGPEYKRAEATAQAQAANRSQDGGDRNGPGRRMNPNARRGGRPRAS